MLWCGTVARTSMRPPSNAAMVMSHWLRRLWIPGRSRPQLSAPNGHSASALTLGPSFVAPDVPRPVDSLPGRLIIVEGIDGSGKSTQLDLLRKWLVNQGYLVIFSEWNSSPIVKSTTRRGKRLQLLSPMSFSLIHAADLGSRRYNQIRPALQSG